MADEKKKEGPEYISIKYDTPFFYNWSTGKRAGHQYTESKENKKIVGQRCPECKQFLIAMPGPVCPKCKIDMGWDWVELPQTGTLIQYTVDIAAMWQPHMGKRWINPYPHAMVQLDDGNYYRTSIGETDQEKLKKLIGARVKAVWHENYDERGFGVKDIKYFQVTDKE